MKLCIPLESFGIRNFHLRCQCLRHGSLDRQILMEGPLQLLDSGKAPEMFVILFDDMLLITRKKKGLSKKVSIDMFLFKKFLFKSSSTSFVENIQIFLTQWTKTLDTFPVRLHLGTEPTQKLLI